MVAPHPNKTIGILVGGGPAPGLNSVIHSVTIEAINNGFQVLGIMEGFRYLAEGVRNMIPLTIEQVSRIHLKGGSILKTSRVNPTKKEETLRNTVQVLLDAGITHLVTIGGDDTAFSAYQVASYAQEKMGVDIRSVHVPKTIDNDLPLPEGIPTFGFETAREVGTRLVINLMEDARTTERWFIVVAMGRKAGHLALGIGKSAGATLTLIPEEWSARPVRLQELADTIVGSILKRMAQGRGHGVAVVAEGMMEIMAPQDLEFLDVVERDEHGHLRLSAEVNSAAIIKQRVRDTLQEIGVKLTLVDKEVGYELRCADPCAYDIDYTRSLGEAAVTFLHEGGTNALITIQQNRAVPVPYTQIMDPQTGRTEVRMVNVDSFAYKSACKFMIRLQPQDFQDQYLLTRIAHHTKLSPEDFIRRFGYLGGMASRPF